MITFPFIVFNRFFKYNLIPLSQKQPSSPKYKLTIMYIKDSFFIYS